MRLNLHQGGMVYGAIKKVSVNMQKCGRAAYFWIKSAMISVKTGWLT